MCPGAAIRLIYNWTRPLLGAHSGNGIIANNGHNPTEWHPLDTGRTRVSALFGASHHWGESESESHYFRTIERVQLAAPEASRAHNGVSTAVPKKQPKKWLHFYN